MSARLTDNLEDLTRFYPKVLIYESGLKVVARFPSDIPDEFFGKVLEFTEDPVYLSAGERIKALSKSSEGTILLFDKRNTFMAPTGSGIDYHFKFDSVINLDLNEEIYNYIVTEMVASMQYYGSVAEIGNLYVTFNDVPRAYNKHTGEYVWGLADWHGVGQEYYNGEIFISHASRDAKKLWGHDWYYWSDYDETLLEIDISTGNFIMHDLSQFGAAVNESFMKPDGRLMLLQGDGTSSTRRTLWNFSSHNGVPTLEPVTDEETLDIWEWWYYIVMHPILNFNHSPDGSMYYYTNWYGIFAFDTKTDKFLWTTTDEIPNTTHEMAIQNPVNGNFYIIAYTDAEVGWSSGESVYEIDGKTGQILRKEPAENDGYSYYYMCGSFPDGKHFYYGSDWDDLYIVNTETLTLETTLGRQIGDYYLPTSKDILGNHLIHRRWPNVDGFTTFNKEGRTHYSAQSWTGLDCNWEQYSNLTPVRDGVITISSNGHLHLVSNNPNLPYKKAGIQKATEPEIIGDYLDEGWYNSDDLSGDWSPPVMVDPRWPSQNRLRTLDFGDGPRLYQIDRPSTASPLISIYRFEEGKFEHFLDREVPVPSTTLSSPNFSSNSGYLYSTTGTGHGTAYNLITEEYKTVPSFSSLSVSTSGVYVDGIEYFLPSSTNVAALMYNHSTNTWSSVTRRPGSYFSDHLYQRSFVYNGDIYSFGTNGLSLPSRRSNIYRFNLPARTWTLITTYENEYTEMDLFIELVGDYFYMPGAGVKFHIPSSTWENIHPNEVAGLSVRGFKDRGIMYYVHRGQHFSQMPNGYWKANSSSVFTSAYALPGALIPY